MNRKKSIKINYIFNTCYQVLLLLTPLITTPYVARVLGADGIGTISYAESIVSYFTLFATMGITTYGQREISYVQDDINKRSVVFWNTKILEWCTSGISIVIYSLFVFFSRKAVIYYIFILNIGSVFADITWFFQGLEEFGKIVMRNVTFKILNIIYIFTFIKSRNDLLLYALGHTVFTFMGNISLWGYLPQYIKKVNKFDLHPFHNWKIVFSLFIPTIAIQIYTVLDKTMIGIITNSAFENGYYEQALKISKMVLMMVASLCTVMIPRIGYHYQKNEISEVKRLMYRGYRFVWFLGIPLCLGLIMISDVFVPWFFGTGYDKVSTLLKILSFLILAIGISSVTGMQYLVPTKRQSLLTLTVVIGAGANFIMNMILIPRFQSIGAAIASIGAESIIAITQIIAVRTELSWLRIIKEGIHYYIAGIIMTLVLIIERIILKPSVSDTIVMIVTGALIYFIILIILKDDFFLNSLKGLFNKIK